MSRCSGTALAVLLVWSAAAPGGDEQKADQVEVEKELQRLQGAWEQVSIEANGQKQGFARGQAPLFIIRGDGYTVEVAGKVLERGRLKMYPVTNPRQSDLIVQGGTGKPRVYPGIYEITGDELRTCFTRDGGARPTTFIAAAESGFSVAVYRRVSPKK
jgi:uncharacterized protein (TIGR03067 family)